MRLLASETKNTDVEERDLEWIRGNWEAAGRLMNENEEFNMAFQAIDQCIWSLLPSLALVMLWGALERLFSPFNYELSFRTSATIASYLEAPGRDRLSCFQKTKKLYDMRSRAAHGSEIENQGVWETYDLLKRALLRMIEENHVPSRQELESILFGA